MEHQYLSPEERTEARKRCEAATPGPWQRQGSHIYGADPVRRDVAQVWYMGRQQDTDNEAFLVHAREDLPAALNTLDRMERDLAELLEAAEPFAGELDYLDDDEPSETCISFETGRGIPGQDLDAGNLRRLAEVVSRLKGRKP